MVENPFGAVCPVCRKECGHSVTGVYIIDLVRPEALVVCVNGASWGERVEFDFSASKKDVLAWLERQPYAPHAFAKCTRRESSGCGGEITSLWEVVVNRDLRQVVAAGHCKCGGVVEYAFLGREQIAALMSGMNVAAKDLVAVEKATTD